MSITNSPGLNADAPLKLDAFRAGAIGADTVFVSVVNGSFRVLGQSTFRTAGATREVAWVQDEGTDTCGLFVQALAGAYGSEVSSSVARELGLRPAPGQPLASRTVFAAIEAAETGKQALAGVDFLTILEHSAYSGGPAFQRIARDLGIDTALLAKPERQRIDAALREKFADASATGKSPVSAETAAQWLKNELKVLTN
ncbi:MAG: hypothetical protein V4609_02030 [Pseudomonadota bacterium]